MECLPPRRHHGLRVLQGLAASFSEKPRKSAFPPAA
jgi:hypothetical protein